MTNIELFNLLCLQILNDLYEAFPRAISDTSTMTEPLVDDEDDNYELSSLRREVISFLAEEGVVRATHSDTEAFYNVRLTMKGLAILGCIPATLQEGKESKSAIQHIKALLGKGVGAATEKASEELVGFLFRLALSGAPAVGALVMSQSA